jgi:YD repeat-containing protein
VVHLFHQDDAKKGREQRSTISSAQDAPYHDAVNYWTSSLSNGVHTVRLEKTEVHTYDGVPGNPKVTRTEYQNFDAYGNAGLTIDHGDISVTGDETYTSREFVYNPDLWIVNRVKHSTVRDSENGTKLRESWFYYDRSFDSSSAPFAGNLTKEEHWNNNGANPVITYKYDSYGNMIRKTDPLGRTTEIVYDATYNTFPELVYNAKNHLTATSFNPVIGKPVSVTDPNGNKTTYAYDVFNRLTKIVKPGDSEAFPTTEMQYVLNGSPPHYVIVKNRETAVGAPSTLFR